MSSHLPVAIYCLLSQKDHPSHLVWENFVTFTTDRTITVVTNYADFDAGASCLLLGRRARY